MLPSSTALLKATYGSETVVTDEDAKKMLTLTKRAVESSFSQTLRPVNDVRISSWLQEKIKSCELDTSFASLTGGVRLMSPIGVQGEENDHSVGF